MEKKGITMRKELKSADKGLYRVLRTRSLLEKVGFVEKVRKWKSMTDDEILDYAKRFMEENEVTTRKELEMADSGLYAVLGQRKLRGRIKFEARQKPPGFFTKMSDDELVAYARRFMGNKGISGRAELWKAASALCSLLKKRNLLGRLSFEERQRDWRSIPDDEIVAYAKKFMKERGITGRTELWKADGGLYNTLKKRKLHDRIGFERRLRNWNGMSDNQLIEHTKRFVKRKKITRKVDLEKEDVGLYETLRKRNLLDRIGLKGNRNWKSMSDDEIVAYAENFIRNKLIHTKAELIHANNALYKALHKRKLLVRAFSDIEQKRLRDARLKVVEALQHFGDAP